jgi:8-amino-7-oxononanoate synthase
MTGFGAQVADLARLRSQTRLRALISQSGVDFASNDYLGLGRSKALADAARAALDRGVPVGSGGSRLLRGNHAEHEALEADAATFFGSESALFFSSGFAANTALFSTLPQTGDLIVHDALIHASAHEGIRIGRAKAVAATHNDVSAIEGAITHWRQTGGTGRAWIAVESLYSMDGDQASLAELAEVATRHDAVLLIDEAHATGVFGAGGRGLAHAFEGCDNVITLRTCGKAMGCEGALICAPRTVRDFLINRGRGFIFSTAPSPLMAAVARAAIGILRDRPELQSGLWSLVRHAETRLAAMGVRASGSQIIPILFGDDARTMAAAGELQAGGFDVRGIRPPTVPAGTSRLRLSLTLNATTADIDRLALHLKSVLG